jgi:spore maturation protein CgeB
LFIGIRSTGTTSFLRSEALQRAIPQATWQFIDTDVPFRSASRISKSLAFRMRLGPAVDAINQCVETQLAPDRYDLIWVDKGVCLRPSVVKTLRKRTDRLVYYTPDTSFLNNNSRFFNQTIDLYDRVITTKSLELDEYAKRMDRSRLLLMTQTYDRHLHFPRYSFAEKRPEAVLVGLCEPDREECVTRLLEANVNVRVGGKGWASFIRRHQRCSHLYFEGDAVFGDHYAEVLGRASIGLGLLTRRFPELHTTRTFEIPACGTLLATLDNNEIRSFFKNDEVLFFGNYQELARNVSRLLADPAELRRISEAGHRRVVSGPFDNDSMVVRVLCDIGVK